MLCFHPATFGMHFHLSVNPFHTIWVMFSPAVEVHWTHVLRAGLLPGVAIAQPIISLLNLDGIDRATQFRGSPDSAEL